eukprot:c14920_g1_i2.p1 GENE.c14920_g1_i2~~c14920_g1_i2.p1  ORF type:complete len:1046 (-),score=130.70 c14920_g1_i2:65-3202(-)
MGNNMVRWLVGWLLLVLCVENRAANSQDYAKLKTAYKSMLDDEINLHAHAHKQQQPQPDDPNSPTTSVGSCSAKSECVTMFGQQYDTETTTSISIEATSNHLQNGTLPTQMARLTNLVFMRVTRFIVGTIPSEIGLLPRLEVLALHSSFMNGSIPSELGQIKTLKLIALASSSLSGTIPIQITHLPALRSLSIMEGQIYGTIPPEIARLPLNHLQLLEMKLSGPIPSELGTTSSLFRLSLFSNNLTGNIPSQLGMLPFLERLHLGENSLSGPIPSQIGQLPNLVDLVLNQNKNIAGEIPTQLGRLSTAYYLGLAQCSIEGTIPSELLQLTEINRLPLYSNYLSGTISTQLNRMTNLFFLPRLHVSHLPTGSQSSSASCSGLGQNLLTGTIPSELAVLEDLSQLLLGDNELTGQIPSQLGLLPVLAVLSLRNNRLHGIIPSQLALVTSLFQLDLSSNRLRGTIPKLPTTLMSVALQHNRLVGQIPSQISLLTNLTMLGLFGNFLSGSVPTLHQPYSSLILLHDNYLSCPLPRHAFTEDTLEVGPRQTLVALGNAFPLDGWNHVSADWLYFWDAKSTHLFVEYPGPWIRLLILVSAVVVVSGMCLCVGQCVGGVRWVTKFDLLWIDCCKLSVGLMCFGVVHMVLLVAAGSLHTCADPLAQVTLAEALRGKWMSGLVVCAVVHAVLSVMALRWLIHRHSPKKGDSILLLPRAPEEWSEQSEEWSKNPRWRTVLFGALWVMCMCALNVPILVDFMAASFPTNNSLGLGSEAVQVLRWSMSPLLVLISEGIIPVLSDFLLTHYYSERVQSSGAFRLAKDQKCFELILASQLLVLVGAPMLSQILVHDRCLRLTRWFWDPCRSSIFNIEKQIGFDTLIVLTQADVCDVGRFHMTEAAACARAVVATTSKLNVFKVVTQALLMLLRNLIVFGPKIHKLPHQWKGKGRLYRWMCWMIPKTVSKDAMTRSVVSWITMAFVFGGVAPLVWEAVFIGLCSSMLTLWLLSGVQRSRGVDTISIGSMPLRVPWALVATGVAIQFVLGIWYFVAVGFFE